MENVCKPLTFSQVYTNSRVKINPRTGEIMERVVASRPIFKAVDAEERRSDITIPGSGRKPASEPKGEEVQRAAKRARKALYDLAACNDFDFFVTLTLDKEKIDRYDWKVVCQKLNRWLDNHVRRDGLFYVLVPEFHKDGAIHFHGLFNDVLRRVNSGKKDKGKVVYNLPQWDYGFTTAVRVTGEYAAVCHYVAKYISKQALGGEVKKVGGRYYLHGGKLLSPVYKYENLDYYAVDGKELHLKDAGLTLKYLNCI